MNNIISDIIAKTDSSRVALVKQGRKGTLSSSYWPAASRKLNFMGKFHFIFIAPLFMGFDFIGVSPHRRFK